MIALVHLVWAPLGPAPLREFLRSYRDHSAGADHELVILLNGVPQPANGVPQPANGASQLVGPDKAAGASGITGAGRRRSRPTRRVAGPGEAHAALLAELHGIEHRLVALERNMPDLAAYAEVARLLEHDRLCFVNSYAVVLADGWLALLGEALARPGVGIAGATGSWESQAEWRRGRLRDWPKQLLALAGARHEYPRFPNPHIRSTGFAAARAEVLRLGLERACDKRSAYLVESGSDSITRRLQGRGLRAVVVGRDGRTYEVPEWPASATYRSGEQRNLLVADRRTRDWERSSPRLRRRLGRDAWGERAS